MDIRKAFNKLRLLVINLDRRIRILTKTQIVIVEHMGKNNKDFRDDYIKAMMSIKEIRAGMDYMEEE